MKNNKLKDRVKEKLNKQALDFSELSENLQNLGQQGMEAIQPWMDPAKQLVQENPYTAAGLAASPFAAIAAKRALFGGPKPPMPPPQAAGGLKGMWAGMSPGAKLAAGLGGAGLGYYGYNKLFGGGSDPRKKITLTM
jgi:hypothetical protein